MGSPISAHLRSVRIGLARRVLDLRSIVGTNNYVPFVIVCIARTGSTMLIDLLNAHPQAVVFGELFRRQDEIGWDVQRHAGLTTDKLLDLFKNDPCAFLDAAVFRRWPRDRCAVGFKIFYYHAREAPHSAVWDYLARRTDILIIHLKRRNRLEQYLSLKLAERTGVWSVTSSAGSPEHPIYLEKEACQRHFEWVRTQESEADAFFARQKMLTVYYEDLVANQAAELSRIQEFLGLDRRSLEGRTRRQRSRPLSQSIENFEELQQDFRYTEWAEFFTDKLATRLSGR